MNEDEIRHDLEVTCFELRQQVALRANINARLLHTEKVIDSLRRRVTMLEELPEKQRKAKEIIR